MREHGVAVNTSGKGPIIEMSGSSKPSATSVKAAFTACEPSPHSAPPVKAGAVKPPAPPAAGAASPPAGGGGETPSGEGE